MLAPCNGRCALLCVTASTGNVQQAYTTIEEGRAAVEEEELEEEDVEAGVEEEVALATGV